MAEPRILIVGAGPTGLGAAWRLNELGHPDWALYEASGHAGGLAASVVDEHGFTWDLGGHVLFSHYRYFDDLMVKALGDRWVEHVREAWVWIRERWVPYPFQNNIWRLPEQELMACLEGLLDLHAGGAVPEPPRSFRDWLLAGFGPGLCDTFMFPYNRKVWAYDPARLGVGWMGERVATVDLTRVLGNLVFRRDDVAWGPNSTFRFPLRGGTGAIWQALYERLPSERIHFNRRVVAVDPRRRVVTLGNGDTVSYDFLVSTMPLDRMLRARSGSPAMASLADRFVHSSTHIVGLGLEGPPPAALRTKCWMYFPEDHLPFYRVTVFSNYSPNNVARPGAQWSLMAEVSESPEKPVDATRIVQQVVQGFRACHFIEDDSPIVSRWHTRLEYGYPTPWLGRDEVLAEAEAALRTGGIFSRGRFGAWKYEVSNQDHSLMQGVEAVNHILLGRPERTFHGDMSDRDP
jgi:protoporphyrinogen oxidase